MADTLRRISGPCGSVAALCLGVIAGIATTGEPNEDGHPCIPDEHGKTEMPELTRMPEEPAGLASVGDGEFDNAFRPEIRLAPGGDHLVMTHPSSDALEADFSFSVELHDDRGRSRMASWDGAARRISPVTPLSAVIELPHGLADGFYVVGVRYLAQDDNLTNSSGYTRAFLAAKDGAMAQIEIQDFYEQSSIDEGLPL